jgi:acyl-CoA thioester hydrolase
MSTAFRYLLRVRYAECDAQKVVFNARYGDYIDLAVTEYFRAMGLAQELANGQFDYQLVKQTIEWKAPARFDQVLEASVIPMKLGTTSFTIAVEFRLFGQEQLLSRAETIYVRVDPAALTKLPLPSWLADRIANLPPGIVVDHAGAEIR